jgi:hypothetical protein
MRTICQVLVVLATAAGAGFLHAGEALQSGPQAGSLLPSSFHPFNLNGKIGKNRYHCLVCEYGLKPVVMVFAREHPDAKEAALADLLQKLDDAVERHQESYLSAFVVILSPDARTSVTEPKTDDASKLVDEAAAWEALLARLRPRAEKLKSVTLGVYPAAGPEGYKLAKEADVTVVLYRRHKVIANYAFAEGKLTDEAVAEIMKRVDAMALESRKKTTGPARKK